MGLLNVDGYYNSLLSFIDKAVEEGFISPTAREIIVSAPTAKELVKKLEVIKVKSSWIVSAFHHNLIHCCCCRNTHLAVKVLRLSFAGRCNGLENDQDQELIYIYYNYLNILYIDMKNV